MKKLMIAAISCTVILLSLLSCDSDTIKNIYQIAKAGITGETVKAEYPYEPTCKGRSIDQVVKDFREENFPDSLTGLQMATQDLCDCFSCIDSDRLLVPTDSIIAYWKSLDPMVDSIMIKAQTFDDNSEEVAAYQMALSIFISSVDLSHPLGAPIRDWRRCYMLKAQQHPKFPTISYKQYKRLERNFKRQCPKAFRTYWSFDQTQLKAMNEALGIESSNGIDIFAVVR